MPEKLKELYKELDRATLARQGAAHLRGRADVRVRRTVRLTWLIAATVIGGAILIGGGFCAWLLHTAQVSGQSFGAVRDQAVRAYAEDADP